MSGSPEAFVTASAAGQPRQAGLRRDAAIGRDDSKGMLACLDGVLGPIHPRRHRDRLAGHPRPDPQAQLNPRDLDWRRFLVAEEAGLVVACVQVRSHPPAAAANSRQPRSSDRIEARELAGPSPRLPSRASWFGRCTSTPSRERRRFGRSSGSGRSKAGQSRATCD